MSGIQITRLKLNPSQFFLKNIQIQTIFYESLVLLGETSPQNALVEIQHNFTIFFKNIIKPYFLIL